MNEYRYRLCWVSVDGAGSDEETVADEQNAIEQANAAQAYANRNGNPWGYSYKVRREYPAKTIYNARTGERYP